MISKLERAHDMMRYLYQHPHTTSDQLAQALHIPASTIRRTISADYPKSFQRHRLGGYVLPDPVIWPEDIEFDLSPAIELDEVTPPVAPPPPPSDQWYRDKIDELTKEIVTLAKGHSTAPRQPSDPARFNVPKPTEKEFQETLIKHAPMVSAINAAVLKYKATPKDDKDYWDMYNMLKSLIIYMNVQVSKDPTAKLKEYVK